MFLAKSWKTVNGKRYPKWDLKKSVWDKEAKRQKQVYIAYVGTDKTLSWEKACEICRDKGVAMEELQRVKGLRIEPPSRPKREELSIDDVLQAPARPEKGASAEGSASEAEAGGDAPEATPAKMVRELREFYRFDRTFEGYDELAYRIDPTLDAEELRMVEQDRAVLTGRPKERLRYKWRWATGRG